MTSNLLALCFLLVASLCLAQRTGTLLINGVQDQRPAVARTGESWTFTLLQDTFRATSSGSSLSYAASGLPSWATFDASSLTLSGTPSSSDEGSAFVTLTATSSDGSSGQDGFDLLVSSEASPTVATAISEQLGNSTTLPTGCVLHHNGALRVPPRWSFSIGLLPTTYVSSTSSVIYYTAYQSGTTRLPSWLHYDNTTNTFDGVAPDDRSYDITLFGSDHYGYGDIQQTFTIQVDEHSFDMLQELPQLNATLGAKVNYTIPIESFIIDDIPVTPRNITMRPDLSQVPYLSFSEEDNTIFGDVPALTRRHLSFRGRHLIRRQATNPATNLSIPITFFSSYGQQIMSTIDMVLQPTLFSMSTLPPILVTPGRPFDADLSGYLGSTTASIAASFSPSNGSDWIQVSSSPFIINGTAPADLTANDNVTVSLTATEESTGATSTSEVVLAYVEEAARQEGDGQLNGDTGGGLSKQGTIALAVVFGIAGAVALALAAFCCMRRSKRRQQDDAMVLAAQQKEREKIASLEGEQEEDGFASAYTRQQKAKSRAISDDHLNDLAAIYTGKKIGSAASMQRSASEGTNLSEAKPKRFDMFRMIRRGSSVGGSMQSGLAQVYSSTSLRGADISRPVQRSDSHNVVIEEEDEGNTYEADDRSDAGSHELDTSSWGSKASSSLFYSDDGTPTGGQSVSGTPRSAPRQRRDFARKPSANKVAQNGAPLPSPIPFPLPNAVKLPWSESQASQLQSDTSSILSRPDALRGAAITRASLQAIKGGSTSNTPQGRSAAAPRLIPFTSERSVPTTHESSRATSVPLDSDDETADAPDLFNRASTLYAPPEDENGQTSTPIFFSTPNTWTSPALSSSARSEVSTVFSAPAIRAVKTTPAKSPPPSPSKTNRYVGGTAAANSPTRKGHARTATASSILDQVHVQVAVGDPFHFT